ncbi:DUF1028 domain-containing protein [Grimontia sp. NTOU-MAR1]|uniref:DUF1028 domain-containing protein n=1 Tax=Grimontia sp. NTOU-MAR1 TaxID=3111011 RepID=UPI002DBDFE56|nr:DUF1028 domain-containing protein [Grimontia sp. NTOU-MAR1]WRW00850.1 DUF1028 domain-containing protein [Grimontia sp. NTOU-MAR1]
MTFSIAAVCRESQMAGCAIASSSICVASRCAFVRSGVGVALSQNITDPALGALLLQRIAEGEEPATAVGFLAGNQANIEWRQIGAINLAGQGALFTGDRALGIHASSQGEDCIAMGNLLDNPDVPLAMTTSFQQSTGALAERLMKALEAGLSAGGEKGPVYSAGLLVTAQHEWPVVNLRVDWHISPITELRMLWQQYEPQMQAYITRAHDPQNAESYGVPGDE